MIFYAKLEHFGTNFADSTQLRGFGTGHFNRLLTIDFV
jgi:hypothetical protein